MTSLVIRNCEKIKLKNLNIETANPNVHKITILKASPFYITFKVDESGKISEENGEYYWYGTDYKMGFTQHKNRGWWMATAKPSNLFHLKRCGTHPLSGSTVIRQIAERTFTARFIIPKDYEVGQVFYMYPRMLKEVGIFVENSKNIELDNVKQHYNNATAFVAQNSENITLKNVEFAPNPHSDVDFGCISDSVLFSMCRGRIRVLDSPFDTAGDDCCSLHGIHFKIVENEGDKITVKFPYHRNYGYECIREGDTIAFVDPKTLLEVGKSKVLHATLRDDYYYDLVLSTYEAPLDVGGVIENVSACPDFEFNGNSLNRVMGVGVSVTTRGKIRIENNRFLNTGEDGVRISEDATTKFDSGFVRDVLISGNAFMNCEENAILIKPENKKYAGPVFSNILIENNLFIINNIYAVNISDSANITLRDNVYKGKPSNYRWVNAKNVVNITTDCPKK